MHQLARRHLHSGLAPIVRLAGEHVRDHRDLIAKIPVLWTETHPKQDGAKSGKIRSYGPTDAGVLNLDGDVAPIVCRCPVYLPERRRRKRMLLKRGKRFFRIATQGARELFAHECEVHRRCLEAQALECVGDGIGGEFGHLSEDLADLHRGATQIAHAGEKTHGTLVFDRGPGFGVLFTAVDNAPEAKCGISDGNSSGGRAE